MATEKKFYDAKPAEPVDELLRPNEGVPEHLQGVALDDIFKYGRIISAILAAIKSVRTLAVGQSEKLGLVKFQLNGKEYEWDLGNLARTK